MPRLNVLGTFEELENTNAYSKFKLRPKRRFHYLHITAEVINEMNTSFSSISILIKNYRVHRLLAISTLITTLTKFYGFRIIWVIKRHPMKKLSTEEHKDAYEPGTKLKAQEELSKEEKSNETTMREVRINLNQPLMDIIKDSSDIDIEGDDSIHEDDLSSLGIINGRCLDMDLLDFDRLEDMKSDVSHYTEDLDDIWLNIEPSSPTHKDEQDNQSINLQLIDNENSNMIKSTQDGKAFEMDGIERRTDEMDELSPRDYNLNPFQTKDNSNEIQKNEKQQTGERCVPTLVIPIPPEDLSSLTFETSSTLSVESSVPRYNGIDSSVSENKNVPNIDLYLVLDAPYQLNIEKLNKIMEQPFKQINYSVDIFDRIYYINEVGIDENDYGLFSFIE